MQETPAHQMYTKFLRPYTHYVPLQSNVSDLSDALQWAMNNEESVLQIIKNASQFIDYIQSEPVLAYTGALLVQYSKLQTCQPQLETAHQLIE